MAGARGSGLSAGRKSHPLPLFVRGCGILYVMKVLFLFLAVAATAFAAGGPGLLLSYYSKSDFPLTADPNAPHWKGVKGVFAANGPDGEPVPGHRTEIRSRWTNGNLYLLFVCPYGELYPHPNPTQTAETDLLWDYDVAEAFIGTDFNDILRYKEFQVSPQGEWVDLDINRHEPPKHDTSWNSGFKVKARLDETKKIWYGEMQIPMAAIDARKPAAGNAMRVNLYRIQGPPPHRTFIAWQPTHNPNYHTPEAFGRLMLK